MLGVFKQAAQPEYASNVSEACGEVESDAVVCSVRERRSKSPHDLD